MGPSGAPFALWLSRQDLAQIFLSPCLSVLWLLLLVGCEPWGGRPQEGWGWEMSNPRALQWVLQSYHAHVHSCCLPPQLVHHPHHVPCLLLV